MSAAAPASAGRPLLVTGGHSFLGLHVARAARDRGHDVTLGHYRPEVGGEASTVRNAFLDMRDRASIRAALAVSQARDVIHLASAGWGESFTAEFDTNVAGVVDLLEECRSVGVHRVVLASSIAVYENTLTRPFTESAAIDALSPSHGPALWKAVQEQLTTYYSRRQGLETISARIAIAYGPGYRSMRSLPSRVARAVVETGVIEGPLTSPYADFVHVHDVAAALVGLCSAELQQVVYNVGSGSATSLDELAEIAARTGLEASEVARLQAAEPWSATSFMDVTAAGRDLEYRPRSFSTGFLQYVNAMRDPAMGRPPTSDRNEG